MGIAIILAYISSIIPSLRAKYHYQLIIWCCAIVIFNLGILIAVPYLPVSSSLPLVKAAKPYMQTNPRVAMYYAYYYDVPFYLNRNILLVNDWQRSIPQFADSWFWRMRYGRELTPKSGHKWLILKSTFNNMWQEHKRMLVFTSQQHYQQLIHTLTPKPILLAAYQQDVFLLTKQPL